MQCTNDAKLKLVHSDIAEGKAIVGFYAVLTGKLLQFRLDHDLDQRRSILTTEKNRSQQRPTEGASRYKECDLLRRYRTS